ncbi:hypothetical protein JCM15519_17360 [Fundidesulfovibrio butyratiphilus]
MSTTHAELVERAKRWLRGQRYAVVVGEVSSLAGEFPDAMGFAATLPSCLVECKASRADFRADAKKYFRRRPERGMGRLRYYLTPPGLISPDEVSTPWGLLYAHPSKIVVAKQPEHVTDLRVAENDAALMISLLSRVAYACDGGIDGLLARYTQQIKEMKAAAKRRREARHA